MSRIPVIAFAGFSGSGKTTLIEKLIPVLKAKGVRTAVVKHDVHGLSVDKEGKDSYRFTQAGADRVVVSSKEQTFRIISDEMSFRQVIDSISGVDLIIVEGYKGEKTRQIGICRKENKKGFTRDINSFIAVVTDTEIKESGIPVFGFEDIEKIAEYIMSEIKDFTHFNDEGKAWMVNVGEKAATVRTAVAGARVFVNENTMSLIKSGGMKKGDVLTVAQIAGIMGSKRTPDLIPMCHPVMINGADLRLSLNEDKGCVEIYAEITCDGKTGVEMEALTAVSTAALTVYDMCKAVQKDMVISDIRLISKTGGIHGDFKREE